jgi:hypothetical protein
MSRKTSNDFEEFISGHKIWSLEFQIFFSIFSEIVKDIAMKFSGMIDLSIVVLDWGMKMSAVTSGRHMK